MSKIINVGKVTAYADAVAGGYQGTREEWEAALAGIGQEATAALAAKEGAEAAQAAAETAQGGAETAEAAAAASAQAAASSAEDAHTDALAATAAKEGAEAAQTLAGQAAAAAAGSAGTAATAQVGAEAAQTAAETAASAAATSAEGAALSEDAAAASAQAAAGSAEDAQEVLDSIPEDYSELSNDVTDLKSAITEDANINYVDEANLLNINGATKDADGYYNFMVQYADAKYGSDTFPHKPFAEDTQYTFSAIFKQAASSGTNGLQIKFKYTDNTSSALVIPINVETPTEYHMTSTAGKSVSKINFSYYSAARVYIKDMMVVEGSSVPEKFIPYDALTAIDYTARHDIANLENDINTELGNIETELTESVSEIDTKLSRIKSEVDMEVSRNLIGPDLDILYPVPPLKTGDIVTISAFAPSKVSTWTQVRFHASDETQIIAYQFDSGNAPTGRQVTLNLGTSTACFISVWHDCGSPLMVELGAKTDFIPHYTTNYEKYLNNASNFGRFELYLPDQAKIIRDNLAVARMTKRLCFGHVSDNHSTVDTLISDIIDASDAKFIVNTGDIIQDKYEDTYTNVSAMINAMTKPYYIALGNHDVYKAPSITDIFDKYYAPIKDHNSQSSLDKTYYAVDFADEKIKCIFLNPYDALPNYAATMDVIIGGKMSATQINWLLGQLDDAVSNSMHVCVFMHLSPEMVGEREEKFFDVNTTDSRLATYSFIPDVIDAYMDGTSVTFTHDGNSYSHTFASGGKFVGYFCGHMHCDCIGKLATHSRQNAFTVTRPWQSPTPSDGDGTYRHGTSEWGRRAFNYVTIDPSTRHVSIMRVLQQETRYGFKRDFMTTEY